MEVVLAAARAQPLLRLPLPLESSRGGMSFIAGLASGGGATGFSSLAGGSGGLAGFSAAGGLGSSSAMIRRIDARISSIEGS